MKSSLVMFDIKFPFKFKTLALLAASHDLFIASEMLWKPQFERSTTLPEAWQMSHLFVADMDGNNRVRDMDGNKRRAMHTLLKRIIAILINLEKS